MRVFKYYTKKKSFFRMLKEKSGSQPEVHSFKVFSIREQLERKSNSGQFSQIFSLALFCLINLSSDGGLESTHVFPKIIFTTKTSFQGCLRVWSRETQALKHSCKFLNLAIFYHAKKRLSKKILFLLVNTPYQK